MICFGWAISIRRPTTACTFSGVTSQGGSVVALIIALSLASGLRQASHFRSTPTRAAMPPPGHCAVGLSLRYLLLPLNVRFLPERVRCEMTAVSLQSKPAILTAGKGVGGRANANCERGDLAYGRQCRFQAACRRLDHLLGHSVLLTIVGYRVGS